MLESDNPCLKSTQPPHFVLAINEIGKPKVLDKGVRVNLLREETFATSYVRLAILYRGE